MSTPGASTYVLGHADVELQRLLLQGRLYNHHTEHALRLAGLREGMRVLDVGCGPGEVSFLAARIVGPTGSVLGVDADGDVIEFARARAAERELPTVSFQTATIAELTLDEPVDAVIGRLILMHLPEPVATLRQLAALVRPGGLIAFSENDITAARSIPTLPEFAGVTDGIVACFRAVGLDPAFGTKLHSLFRRAGLPAPRLTSGAPVGGANDTDVLAYAVEVWRLMLPVATRLGLVTDELADVETLLPTWRDELAAVDAIMMMPPLLTAWSRLPT
ncbi:class I SAM-dependent methyltransferase [Mycobacterium sp. DL592]|uniref:class I SAM-dependent methyltransferase n=1 Tax=Mycobacterium sp. DL592 TaxID=2675524 RepID=UPI00141F3888|nr:class I SAM-dependent methyltransferase [Mycobacterium sp. DL592]